METTGKKRGNVRRIGKGVPPPGKKFSRDNQPSAQAKKDGWERRKKGMALVRTILSLTMTGETSKTIRRRCADFFGIPEQDLTVEDLLHFKQAERAIKSGDTNAYKALLDKSGNFKTELSLSGEVNQNVKMTLDQLPTEQLERMLEIFSQSKQQHK